jgi:hypothetical protein
MKTIRYVSEIMSAILIASSAVQAKTIVTPPPLPPSYLFPPTNTVKKTASANTTANVNTTSTSATPAGKSQGPDNPDPAPPTYLLQIGTYSNVLNYTVTHVSLITLDVFVWNTNNGSWKAYFVGVWYASATNYVTSKAQMDQQIIALQITNVISQIITNTNPTIDKSKGVLIYTTCGFQTNNATSYENLDAYEVISLPKNSDGSYGMPDLSSFSTTLADYISFYVPSLQWARLEIGYKGDTDPFEIDDELYDPGSNPIDSAGFLEIQTSYITDSSISSGDFWMKITLLSGSTFKIANGDGIQIPESLMKLVIRKNGANDLVTVTNGDSGRGFFLQSSMNLADVNSWTNCSPVTFVSPTNGVPSLFNVPKTNSNSFFRTTTTNTVPH